MKGISVTTQKVVVITGAAQGIGRACAEAFADRKYRLVLIDRLDTVHQVGGEIGAHDALSYAVDLSDAKGVEALTSEIDGAAGGVDILVNNAGINPKSTDGTAARVSNTTLDEWNRVLATNLTSAFLLSKWALSSMKERAWGRIVNISSRGGRVYSPAAGAHYAASKAALIGFNRALAGEGGPLGITANCVAPGRIDTPLTASAGAGSDEMRSRFLQETPVGRVGTADEIAAAVKFLASDGAAFITGAVIDVNGGSFG